jgi:hypothetical protein
MCQAVYAQNPPPPSSDDGSAQSSPQQSATPADSYAVSLRNGDLINLSGEDAVNANNTASSSTESSAAPGLSGHGRDSSRQVLYGLSLASAYISDYAGVGTPGQFSTTFSPYLALLVPTSTGHFLVQYNAVVNPRDPSVLGGGPQAYQTLSLTVQRALSRRWSWTVAASSGFGSEATRLEGPLSYSLVQTTPVLDASSTVLLPATNVLFFNNTAQLAFQQNERNWFGFTLLHTYTGIDGDPSDPAAPAQHSTTIGIRADYGHAISTRLTVNAYGDEQTLVGGPGCYSYGGGVGLSAKLTRAVSLDVQGGPQFTSSGCGVPQAGNFKAVLADRLNRKDRIYLSVSREFTTAYQTKPGSQDDVAVGFSKGLGPSTFSIDGGFVRDTLPGVQQYHGYFVAPRFHVKIANSLGLTAGYRAFRVTGGGLPSGVLNVVAVSLDWFPAGRHF